MKRQGTRIITAIVLLCVFILSGCGKQDSFMSAVKSGNYAKAIEIYEKKIDGNSKEELAVRDALESYLESAWNAYVEGSMSQEKFRVCYWSLERINDKFGILPEVLQMAYGYGMMEASKTSFLNGKAYAESGDYAAAMEAFAQVIPEDKGNYEEAVKAANRARSDAIGQAYRAGEYLVVIRFYEEALDDPSAEILSGMTQAYEESRHAYVKEVSAAAYTAFENGRDYQAAITIVRKALDEAIFSDVLVNELEPMLDEYGSYAPVALTTLDVVHWGGYVETGYWRGTRSDTYTDVNGTVYESDKMIYPEEGDNGWGSPKDEDDCAVTYLLDGQFSSFTGTVFRPCGTLSLEDWKNNNGRVKIYGDGRLIFDSGDIDDSTWEPIHFTLDVSGVRELKVMTWGRWRENNAWATAHPKVCAADLMVQK